MLIGASVVVGGAAHWVAGNPAWLPWPALIAWAAAIGLLLAGAWLLGPQRPAFALARLRGARWELSAVAGITLLALLLRTAALDSIPYNFGGDEGEMGSMARMVLSGELRDPFATGWMSHPMLWFFAQ